MVNSSTLARSFGRGQALNRSDTPAAILAGARVGRRVLEGFRALAESLEWELGQRYSRERRNKAFLHDAEPVPFAVNNGGNLSRRCAEVFFASLEAAERAGALEEEIFVLEIGIGVENGKEDERRESFHNSFVPSRERKKVRESWLLARQRALK